MNQSGSNGSQIPKWAMVLGLMLLAVGAVLTALVASWFWPWDKSLGDADKWTRVGLLASIVVMITGPIIMLAARRKLPDRGEGAGDQEEKPGKDQEEKKRAHQQRLYNRYLTGLGYALLVVGLGTAVTAGGLIRQGVIGMSGKAFRSPDSWSEKKKRPSTKRTAAPAQTPGSESVTGEGAGTTTTGQTAASVQAPVAETASPEESGSAAAGPTSTPAAPSDTQSDQQKVPDWNTLYSTRRTRTGMILLFSTEMSLLGALFFVSNRLRERRDKWVTADNPEEAAAAGSETKDQIHREEFDAGKFWGGTFFRLGEAVLFTFVFFLLLWKYGGDDPTYTLLPVLAIFLGMFVKTGERIIFGLGQRMLAGASELFPLPPEKPKKNDQDGGS